jgi:hypothetical protein
VTEEVLKRLQRGGSLNPAIDAGIQRYLQLQAGRENAARAEKARVARERAKMVPLIDGERDHVWGNREAGISLIKYSDFQCPFRKRSPEGWGSDLELCMGKMM